MTEPQGGEGGKGGSVKFLTCFFRAPLTHFYIFSFDMKYQDSTIDKSMYIYGGPHYIPAIFFRTALMKLGREDTDAS